jgi:uncharacterized protein YegL
LPPDRGLLAALATEADGYLPALAPSDLSDVYASMGRGLSDRYLLTHLDVVDQLPTNMRLVPGSLDPPAEVLPDGSLHWRFDAVTTGGMPPLRYTLEPLVAGLWPTNVSALAAYTDGLGFAGQTLFPVPTVDVWVPEPTATDTVIPPTSTPTLEPSATPDPRATETATESPSPTATVTPLRPPTVTPPASPTSRPPRIFLPAAFKAPACTPKTAPVDVALVIDVSSSMTGPKLAAASDAARSFVKLLDLSRDRAGVVIFDQDAHVVLGLTSDGRALDRVLSGLTPGVGTRIDLGLRDGLSMVAGAGARPSADPVLVLLTDGRPTTGTEGDLELVSIVARDLGVALYAVGLGADVDVAELRLIAGGRNDRVYLAPNEADLRNIYAQIARVLPCR